MLNFVKNVIISILFIIIGLVVVETFVPAGMRWIFNIIVVYGALVSLVRGVRNPVKAYYRHMCKRANRLGSHAGFTLRELELDTDDMFVTWDNASAKRRRHIRKVLNNAISMNRYVAPYQL